MKILISGGAGFLGLNTAKLLFERGHSVVVTSRRRENPVVDSLAAQSGGALAVEVLDLANPYSVVDLLSRYRFDRVIHTATAHMFANGRAANFSSYHMLFNMLEAATSAGVEHFVLASSIAVYPGAPAPYREDTPLPSDLSAIPDRRLPFPSFEATLKRAMELVALDYGVPMASWDRAPTTGATGARRQMQTAVVRYPFQIGPYYSSMYNPIANLVHGYARADFAMCTRRPLAPFADISYVLDNADSLSTVALADNRGHRIYNASSNIHATARDIIEAFYRIAPDARDKVRIDPEAQSDEKSDQFFDITRIGQDLGWKPRFTLDTMLANYLDWLRDHPF